MISGGASCSQLEIFVGVDFVTPSLRKPCKWQAALYAGSRSIARKTAVYHKRHDL